MKKKGFELGELMLIILGIVFIAIILGFLIKIKPTTDKELSNTRCKNSVTLNAKNFEIGGQDVILPQRDLDCPTNNVEIKNLRDVKPTIANELYDCWNKFHEGEVRFFPQKQQTLCIVCSKISFSNDIRGKEVDGFLEYLNENNVPLSKESYLTYLRGYETKLGELDKEIKEKKDVGISDSIDTSYDYYYTVFVAHSTERFNQIKAGALGGFATSELTAIGLMVVLASIPTGGVGGAVIVTLVKLTPTILTAAGTLGFMKSYGFGNKQGVDWVANVLLVPNDPSSLKECDQIQVGK